MRIDRRLLAILLGASLFANLFLGGAIVGGRLGRRPEAGVGAFTPRRLVRRLSPDERARFVQTMAPYRGELHASRQAVRRARVEADVAAPDYDRVKVAKDFAALRQVAASQQALMQGALTEALSRISPASRQMPVVRVGLDKPDWEQPRSPGRDRLHPLWSGRASRRVGAACADLIATLTSIADGASLPTSWRSLHV